MTDTPALLPPDPDRPGRYWMKPRWGDDIVARWNPSGRYWNAWEFSVLTAKHAAVLGYTLASPHPIPSAAALKRLHNPTKAMVDAVLSGLALDARIPDIIAAMLRAALEDKP